MANPTGKGLKPFPKGVSGNPAGRPKKAVALEAWRKANAEMAQDAITADEVHDAWLRWFARFRVGDPKALWMVPYLFGQPPKATEPEGATETPTTVYEMRYVSGGERPVDQPAGAAPGAGQDQGRG